MTSPRRTRKPDTREPLRRSLAIQQKTDREIVALLREAAQEAEDVIVRLAGVPGIGAQIERAQAQALLSALRQRQQELWVGRIGPAIRRGVQDAAVGAAESANLIRAWLLSSVGVDSGPLAAAMEAFAQETYRTLLARGAANIPLSEQVYRSEAWSQGLINRTINRNILLGRSWRDLARDLEALINSDVPGGVSYAARRTARTELNNAFHQSSIAQYSRDPWISGVQWHLSSSHPRGDACDSLAHDSHLRGGAPGVFAVDDVPGKPHPQCFCYITPVTMNSADFADAFARGEFDDYLRAAGV